MMSMSLDLVDDQVGFNDLSISSMKLLKESVKFLLRKQQNKTIFPDQNSSIYLSCYSIFDEYISVETIFEKIQKFALKYKVNIEDSDCSYEYKKVKFNICINYKNYQTSIPPEENELDVLINDKLFDDDLTDAFSNGYDDEIVAEGFVIDAIPRCITKDLSQIVVLSEFLSEITNVIKKELHVIHDKQKIYIESSPTRKNKLEKKLTNKKIEFESSGDFETSLDYNVSIHNLIATFIR